MTVKKTAEDVLREIVVQARALHRGSPSDLTDWILKQSRYVPSLRRKDVPGCKVCESAFLPYHDASPFCESGGHDHCTCDMCF